MKDTRFTRISHIKSDTDVIITIALYCMADDLAARGLDNRKARLAAQRYLDGRLTRVEQSVVFSFCFNDKPEVWRKWVELQIAESSFPEQDRQFYLRLENESLGKNADNLKQPYPDGSCWSEILSYTESNFEWLDAVG